MYLQFYGLAEPPFSITPDPRFVYLSERHRDALAHLLYGIGQGGSGGFVQLTGEVGTGKTTLCRLLLEQMPADSRVALVLNPRLSPVELVETICEELKLEVEPVRGSLKGLVDLLNSYLLRAYGEGLRVVLIIDEAQNLSFEALEQVRLLTNLETATQKLLQIILLGQPELRETLARAELRQLTQRITARFHLTPLSADETEDYLRHRLVVAGCPRFPFSRLAVRRIHQHAGGVPRLINVIADRALTAGYVGELNQIGEHEVERAAREALASPARRARPWLLTAGAVIAVALVFALIWRSRAPAPAPEAAAPTVVAVAPSTAATNALIDEAGLRSLIEGSDGTSFAGWNHLLALWNLRAREADVRTAQRCPLQLGTGVYCLRAAGNLAKLETLRRPVLLRLTSGDREAWAVLLGSGETRVRLLLDGETIEAPRVLFERLWLGEFHVVWRAPGFVGGTLRRGDAGAAVDWLAQRLLEARHLGELSTGPQQFDATMEQAVRRLQAAHGLVPDGIVGPETLFAATTHLSGGPRLRRLR
ncbi:type II secretion system protein A [Aquimonas voraii]|uniref:Type II secretion system protein A n=2 Tax=Aquimonas voraii TaxID=265719 RepID=A0A1G6XP20_9GAMM|nr:type II secretion system protein A [Aquimonas voraii]